MRNQFIFSSFVLVWLSVSFLYAQNNQPQTMKLKNALQFQITDNFKLSSFQGSVLSYKNHFSPNNAIRFGISLDVGFNGSDDHSTSSDTLTIIRKANYKNIEFDIIGQYLHYFSSNNNVSFYFGIGPILGYSNRWSDSKSNYNTIQTNKNESEYIAYKIGISNVLGIEWFLHEKFSLLAEYGLNFIYNYSKIEDYRTNEERRSHTDGMNLRGASVKFGVSLYF